MMYISIFIFLLMLQLNSMFKMASFLRLGIPLLYALFVSILFPDFVQEHEILATAIFLAMLGLVILSWVVTIRKKYCAGGNRDNMNKYKRLISLQSHHLPYHPVGHLDGTDQHQHIEN
jgi:hypothetical protein